MIAITRVAATASETPVQQESDLAHFSRERERLRALQRVVCEKRLVSQV
jgi:hypothetical protein